MAEGTEKTEMWSAAREEKIRATAYQRGFANGVEVGQSGADPVITRAGLEMEKQRAYREGYRHGGDAERVLPAFNFTTEEAIDPTPFGAAVEALQAASRSVVPVQMEFDDNATEEAARRHVLLVTTVADGLVRWLSEHIEPGTYDADALLCGACGNPRDQHTAGCLYGSTWGRKPDTGMVANGWCVECGAHPGSHFGTCSKLGPNAPAGEGEDGAPLPPEQQPVWPAEAVDPDGPVVENVDHRCPECRAGKHANCPGEVPDTSGYSIACPCHEGVCAD